MSMRLPLDHPMVRNLLTPSELAKLTKKPRKTKRPGETSAEDKIAETLRILGLTRGMERQFRFHMERQWRADFAWPAFKLLVEYDGLILVNEGGKCQVRGGHATVTGIRNDHEKANAAQMSGFTLLRYEAQAVRDGRIYSDIEAVLRARGWT